MTQRPLASVFPNCIQCLLQIRNASSLLSSISPSFLSLCHPNWLTRQQDTQQLRLHESKIFIWMVYLESMALLIPSILGSCTIGSHVAWKPFSSNAPSLVNRTNIHSSVLITGGGILPSCVSRPLSNVIVWEISHIIFETRWPNLNEPQRHNGPKLYNDVL